MVLVSYFEEFMTSFTPGGMDESVVSKILLFSAAEVAKLAAKARRSKKFRLTLDEKFNPANYLGRQVKYKDGAYLPDPSSIDMKKIGPKFWLCGDEKGGIYLTTNAFIQKGQEEAKLYAVGYGPDEDSSVISRIRLEEGEPIPIPLIDFEVPITMGVKDVKIKVEEETVRVYG